MRLASLKTVLIVVLTMTLFSVAFPSPAATAQAGASAPQVKVLQKLDDGSVAVSIDGQKYLAITREHLDAWQKLQIDYDGLVKLRAEDAGQLATLQRKWELAVTDTATATAKADSYKTDFERAREDAQRNFALFMSERELRTEAQQFIPHGNGGSGPFAKLLAFLDKPAVQASFKLGVPLYQTWKCS